MKSIFLFFLFHFKFNLTILISSPNPLQAQPKCSQLHLHAPYVVPLVPLAAVIVLILIEYDGENAATCTILNKYTSISVHKQCQEPKTLKKLENTALTPISDDVDIDHDETNLVL